ncbi:MAG: hypothetical protein M1834_008913 [Cirrosporium novae-zelandiae]|nr:MAG: hypothetical protein M1834_008913 [Cirrosporium novae-zelandiae]
MAQFLNHIYKKVFSTVHNSKENVPINANDNKKRVAIIGAGVSGVAGAAHLKAAGIDVVVFERNSVAGGVWVFDERKPIEPPYPSVDASLPESEYPGQWGDNAVKESAPTDGYDIDEVNLRHAPPGPCYASLMNNISTPLLQLKVNSFPPKTPDYVNHKVLEEYIQDTAQKTGVDELILYNTNVDNAEKEDGKWWLSTSTLKSGKKVAQNWKFDTLVIASGHYHACNVPDIPGLSEWKARWPERIQHSKGYRRPLEFKDKNVLLIGAGVSSTDIARDVAPIANQIYQVSRNGPFDLPASFLPVGATRIGEIASFEKPPGKVDNSLATDQAIPSSVALKNGTKLENIHNVIVCTGYHCSYPFLRTYHSNKTPTEPASDTVLVTDGIQTHNLHKDIFYIPDPTLAFIGVPYFTATFTLFEFQAIVLAAILSGKASLPTEEDMRTEYRQRMAEKGTGKAFHSLKNQEVEYVDQLMDWINTDGRKLGVKPIEGHTKEWHEANVDRMEKLRLRMEAKNGDEVERLNNLAKDRHIL